MIVNDEDDSLNSIESLTGHLEEPLEVDETNIEKETTTEVENQASRRGGLRLNKSVSYDHIMTIVLSQMSVGKGLKLLGDRTVEAVTKDFAQLDEKGVLIPVEFG